MDDASRDRIPDEQSASRKGDEAPQGRGLVEPEEEPGTSDDDYAND